MRRVQRLFLRLMVLAMAVIIGCVGWLWVQHNRRVTLPLPPGPYPVGRVGYEWTDSSRVDTLANEPGQERTLTVWIWYPATPTPDDATAPYLPAAWVRARRKVVGVGALLTQNLSTVQPHALANAPLAADQSPYPVLIMQPGLGPLITDYTTLAEGLASQGYVVVGSNPTYSASVVVFHDGRSAFGTPAGNVPDAASPAKARAILDRLITVWAADDEFVLDQLDRLNASDPSGTFTGQLDLRAVGLLGHSFGGATAAQVCRLDPRCQAGIDIDGYPYGTVVQDGLHQPFMFIWSEPTDRTDGGWQQAMQDAQAIATKWPHDHYELMIDGTRHFNFSDYAILFSPVLRWMGGLGSIEGHRGLEITVEYVQGFFDRYLKHQDDPLLRGSSSAYPEVRWVSR